jgi:anthranilate phosphoribosyltransferase
VTRTLEQLLDRRDLTEDEAADLLEQLTDERLPPAMTGAVLAALRTKGETPDELRGFARAMRRLARRPAVASDSPLADTCGTGGDASGSLNFSTGSALLAAACGVRVAKHGNRSVSSRSGSADCLEALGLPMPLDEREAGACLAETGFTFLFAPYFHPAMKALAPVRRTMGVRTVFNLLGPLTNPAEPAFQLVGTFSAGAASLLAETLAGLPIERAFVVHGAGGWDEPTPAGPFLLLDVRPGRVEREIRDPEELGLPRCRLEDLAGGDAADNAAALARILDGEPGPRRDAVVLGAALVLEMVGRAPDAAAGVAEARSALDDGRARTVLGRVTEFGRRHEPRG